MTRALVRKKKKVPSRRVWCSPFDSFFCWGWPYYPNLLRWAFTDVPRLFEVVERNINVSFGHKDGTGKLVFSGLDDFDKDNIKADYDGEYFKIVASKKTKKSSRTLHNHYYLPDIDGEKVDAEFKDGELIVTFPYETEGPEEETTAIDIK